MIRALTTAATGMEAQQTNIERISNDLANANTDGYKRSRNEFQDLMYHTIKEPGGATGASSQSPVGIQIGMGVKVGASHKMFEPGPTRMTYNPYDWMIEGNGFFGVQMPAGDIAYTKTGVFHRDSQGRIVLGNGAQLIPAIQVPANTTGINVTQSGEVKVTTATEGEATVGQLQLVTFQNPEGLSAIGNSLYKPTAGSGTPLQGMPGENGLGFIQQGAVEGSNVNVANSMVDMIQTQRTYEMNTKVMGVADSMLNATVNVVK